MTIKQLVSNRDPESVPIYTAEITDSGWTSLIPSDTDVSIAVPAGARFFMAGGSTNYFLGGSAITLPSLGVVTQTDAELNKTQGKINGETAIHVRGRDQMDFSISFWR